MEAARLEVGAMEARLEVGAMEARLETGAMDVALAWHCSLLWIMKLVKVLKCFLHFPQRKTSSSSVKQGEHTSFKKQIHIKKK